jgi:hypothetical protein
MNIFAVLQYLKILAGIEVNDTLVHPLKQYDKSTIALVFPAYVLNTSSSTVVREVQPLNTYETFVTDLLY